MPFVCSVVLSVWYCSKPIPMWLTCKSVSTSHLTTAYSWCHWIVMHSTCVHTDSTEAWGTFVAHLYGTNGASTSGTSRMGIIGDLFNSPPSATMPNRQKECNIIKTWIFYCFTRWIFYRAPCTYLPLFIYLHLYEFCSIKDLYIALQWTRRELLHFHT